MHRVEISNFAFFVRGLLMESYMNSEIFTGSGKCNVLICLRL